MAHTSDGGALFRAICEHPDEDTPRLVYADWLDEHGGEPNAARAEFIRIQVAEAAKRGPGSEYDTFHRTKTPREKELLARWGKEWHGSLPELPGIIWQEHQYERGFIYHVGAGSVRSLLKGAPEVFSRAPVTWVTLDKLTATTAKQLAKCPEVARLRRLDKFSLENWEPDALVPLADTPHLCNLRTMHLWHAGIGAASIRALLGNKALTHLTRLTLDGCPAAGDDIILGLVNSPSARVIESLQLQGCGIGSGAAAAVAALVRLPKLRQVFLTSNRIGNPVPIELADVSVEKEIRVGLSYNAITDGGAAALLKGRFLAPPGVTVTLDGNRITNGMKARLKDAFGDRVRF